MVVGLNGKPVRQVQLRYSKEVTVSSFYSTLQFYLFSLAGTDARTRLEEKSLEIIEKDKNQEKEKDHIGPC